MITTHDFLKRSALYAAVVMSLTLMVVKAAAWVMSNSVTVLSSLVDSGLDLVSSIIILVSLRVAGSPADKDHRFGHEKAEAVGALLQGAIIIGSVTLLLFESGRRLIYPATLGHGTYAIAVTALSLVLTVALVLYQRLVVRKTHSLAVRANMLQFTGDILMNILALAGTYFAYTLGNALIDTLCALTLSAFLINSSLNIIFQALHQLMDTELSDDEREAIRTMIHEHPSVVNVHDLRTRTAGKKYFIQFHLELDGQLTLEDAHQVSDAIEHRIRHRFTTAHISIHKEPAGIEDERDNF